MMWRVASPPGSVTITISACGSSSGSSSTPCTGIPSSSRALEATTRQLDLERREACGDRLADPAVAEQQHAAVGEARRELRRPAALVLRAHEGRQAALRRRARARRRARRSMSHAPRRRWRTRSPGGQHRRRRPRSRWTGSARAARRTSASRREHRRPSTCTAARRCRSRRAAPGRSIAQTSSSTPSGTGCESAASSFGRDGHDKGRGAHRSTLPARCRPSGALVGDRRAAAIRSPRAVGSRGGGCHGSRDQLLGGAARDRVEHGRRLDLVHAEGVRHALGEARERRHGPAGRVRDDRRSSSR